MSVISGHRFEVRTFKFSYSSSTVFRVASLGTVFRVAHWHIYMFFTVISIVYTLIVM